MKHAIASLMLAVLLAPAAGAQQLDPAIAKLAEMRVRSGAVPGLVVGTIVGRDVRVQGFGALSTARSGRPDADTVYEIGSVTKTFTALLLADAVARGTLKLDAPVAQSLPDYRIPRLGARELTLLDLATQSSGLPRLPDNMTPAQLDNPYADYSADKLKTFLAGHTLARTPGSQYEYSNLGFGLLGTALATAAHKDYAALVSERITGPLGMAHTGVTLKGEMLARLAPGHGVGGVPAANWDFTSLAGAGALRSSAADMLRYLQALMHPDSAPALPGLRLVQQPQRAAGAASEQIGLAWHLRQLGGRTVVWHSGMTGGYASFIAFTADGERGVVVLANATSSLDDLGLDALLPQLRAADQAPLAGEVLAQYLGRYQLAPGFVLTVSALDGTLMAQATGQSPAPVYPVKSDEFAYRVVEAHLQFQRGADGKVNAVVLHQGGRAMPAPRIIGEPPPAPKEIKLAVDELRQYAGSYVLAPAFRIAVMEEGGRLFIQATGQGRSEVFPSARDEVFSKLVDAQISFRRDAKGAVSGLVLHQNGQHVPGPRAVD